MQASQKGHLDLKLVRSKKGRNNQPIIYWEHRVDSLTLSTKKIELPLVYAEDVDDLGISLPKFPEAGNGQLE